MTAPRSARPFLTRTAIPAGLAVAALLTATGSAHAGNSSREPIEPDPAVRTVPANRCGFEVIYTVLEDQRYQVTNPGGTRETGRYVVRLDNLANGKSLTYNLNGSKTTTVNGTTETRVYAGQQLFVSGPISQANTGLPGLAYIPGRVVATIDTVAVVTTSVQANSPITDVCALLT